MNRKGFMAELRNLLVFMDAKDRARVIKRYETMFDEAGEDGEQTLIRCFGSPVRQVLMIEQEYRDAQNRGELPFADVEKDLPSPMPREEAPEEAEEDEAVPEESEPEDGEEAAEAEAPAPEPEPTLPAAEITAGEELSEPSQQDALSSEPLDLSDPELPAEEAIVPVAEAAMPWEEERKNRSRPEPQPDLPEKDEDDYEDDYEDDEDDADDADDGEERHRPGAGRIIGAVLVTIPLLAVWAVGFSFFLALGVGVIGAGIACGAAALYLMSYVFSGVISFAPDLMLVGGGALVTAAIALLLIWMGLWIAIGGCILIVRMSASIYRGILGKEWEE